MKKIIFVEYIFSGEEIKRREERKEWKKRRGRRWKSKRRKNNPRPGCLLTHGILDKRATGPIYVTSSKFVVFRGEILSIYAPLARRSARESPFTDLPR